MHVQQSWRISEVLHYISTILRESLTVCKKRLNFWQTSHGLSGKTALDVRTNITTNIPIDRFSPMWEHNLNNTECHKMLSSVEAKVFLIWWLLRPEISYTIIESESDSSENFFERIFYHWRFGFWKLYYCATLPQLVSFIVMHSVVAVRITGSHGKRCGCLISIVEYRLPLIATTIMAGYFSIELLHV